MSTTKDEFVAEFNKLQLEINERRDKQLKIAGKLELLDQLEKPKEETPLKEETPK